MSTTFDVTFPGGVVYQIGGRPLCSKEKLQKVFPNLYTAIYDNDIQEYDESHELTIEEAEKKEAETTKMIFGIVDHFNEDVNEETFLIDLYCVNETLKVWMGLGEQGEKKNTQQKP